MRRSFLWSFLCCLILVSPSLSFATDQPVRIGSKNFNENYLLAEMLAQLLESEGIQVERRFGLGGTLICFEALKNGEIDIYVEYTGTLSQAIFNLPVSATNQNLQAQLSQSGLVMLDAFGFNNTYALAVRQETAAQHNLSTIKDLATVGTDLKMVFSHEFLERQDGWPGLRQTYGLNAEPTGIEHGLAYKALSDGAIDVTDVYSTDGELERYQLVVLQDSLGYFPTYLAVPLVTESLADKVRPLFERLSGSIDDELMQQLNARVVFDKLSFAEVAGEFWAERGVIVEVEQSGLWSGLLKNTLRHLQLTGMALALAIVFGVGVGLVVYDRPRLRETVIYLCGLMQTIPSIALLALMIPLFGIGLLPAVVALFLYSLLPILRNTVTALSTVDPTLVRVAVAIGLQPHEQLRHVLLPLSVPQIFAGIRTAAVISIGTATLAAFIGAGGLGDPIVVGLSLNDTNLILQGAIPAALLAILTEIIFSWIERKIR